MKPIHITLDNWTVQKEAAQFVRLQVFVHEQKVPLEMEWDAMDEQCIHAVATNSKGEAIGTGRLLPDGHIGRMAVMASARGAGVGGLLLQRLMQAAKDRGDKRIVLSAQLHALGFYAHYGFTAFGQEYMEAGIMHRDMEHYF